MFCGRDEDCSSRTEPFPQALASCNDRFDFFSERLPLLEVVVPVEAINVSTVPSCDISDISDINLSEQLNKPP